MQLDAAELLQVPAPHARRAQPVQTEQEQQELIQRLAQRAGCVFWATGRTSAGAHATSAERARVTVCAHDTQQDMLARVSLSLREPLRPFPINVLVHDVEPDALVLYVPAPQAAVMMITKNE